MTDAFFEKFSSRLAHNGGEAFIFDETGGAAKILASLARAEAHGSAPAGIYLSKALDARLEAELSRAFRGDETFKLLDAVSDGAVLSVVPAAALMARDGAIVIDAARLAHEETLFGAVCAPIACEKTELYPGMAEFFTAVDAGKSSVRADKIVIIAGPSKTADIEKQVVLGMHGPRRLVCLLKRRAAAGACFL